MQSILRSYRTEILHLCADFSRLWQSLNILTLAIYVSPSFSNSLYIEVDVGHIWHCLRDKFVACRLTYIIPHYFCASCCPIVPLVINPINSKRTANLLVFVAQHSHRHTYLHGYPYSEKNEQQTNWVNVNARDWPRRGEVSMGVFALVWSSSGCTKRLSRSYLTSRHNDD